MKTFTLAGGLGCSRLVKDAKPAPRLLPLYLTHSIPFSATELPILSAPSFLRMPKTPHPSLTTGVNPSKALADTRWLDSQPSPHARLHVNPSQEFPVTHQAREEAAHSCRSRQ